MHSRWFNVAVVLLWTTTMGWLFAKKILPSFWIGEPPAAEEILAAQKTETLVGWTMLWNRRPVGWALTDTVPLPEDLTEVRSRVHFDELPLPKVFAEQLELGSLASLQLDLDSTLVYDAFGRLARFEAAARIPPAEPHESLLKIRGAIDGTQLALSVRSGKIHSDLQLAAPSKAVMRDSFSLHTRLPGLREGQHWTIQTYSPRPTGDPQELLHAEVEAQRRIPWNGHEAEVWKVVFRSDSAAATHQESKPVGILWVRPDGVVLRQEAVYFGSTMTLERLTEEESKQLAARIGYRREGY